MNEFSSMGTRFISSMNSPRSPEVAGRLADGSAAPISTCCSASNSRRSPAAHTMPPACAKRDASCGDRPWISTQLSSRRPARTGRRSQKIRACCGCAPSRFRLAVGPRSGRPRGTLPRWETGRSRQNPGSDMPLAMPVGAVNRRCSTRHRRLPQTKRDMRSRYRKPRRRHPNFVGTIASFPL